LIAGGIFAVFIVAEAVVGGHNWFAAAVPPVLAMSAWGCLWAAGKKAAGRKKAGR
jgi:hypothetical protein